jgi:hypothetical protein
MHEMMNPTMAKIIETVMCQVRSFVRPEFQAHETAKIPAAT